VSAGDGCWTSAAGPASTPCWRVDAIEPVTMDTVGGGSNQAWLATMTRRAATGGRMA
jgi:hypothetical protein